MRLVFIKRHKLAARDGGARFTDIGFRPRQIVAFLAGALGNPLVNKLARRGFDRNEIAVRDTGLAPCFLVGRKRNRHDFLYHKAVGRHNTTACVRESAYETLPAPADPGRYRDRT
jgi:hypothetical protein